MILLNRIWCTVLLVAVAGCVAKAPAPVIDKSRQSDHAYAENQAVCQAKTPEEFCHVVERGDTLYAISRRYGLKVVEIASRNEVKAPYIIRPGELLVVRQGDEPVSAPAQATPTQITQTEAPTSQPMPSDDAKSAPVEPKKQPVPTPVAAETPSAPPSPSASAPSDTSTTKTPQVPVKMTLRTTRTKSGWQWPVPYEPTSNKDKKGLEYRLADDTEVVAAIGGKVIYAGAGLNKFRHLIIVDSATAHLVAYEFNTAHDIKEGQGISRGDTITRITRGDGDPSTDTERYRQFRFEIWANGKPLNPDSVIAAASRN